MKLTKTIGIIGSGLVGKAVARLAVQAGYEVVVSNATGPESLAGFVEELGESARAGTVDEAAAAGDIVTLSIPLPALESVPTASFEGKVVLDQTNYYPAFGANEVLDSGELTSSELVQKHLQGAKVVKGMHNQSWLHIKSNARPHGASDRTTLPIAGDDAEAKSRITEFFDEIGFDVVDAGSLSESWRIEPSTPIYFWPYAPSVPEGLSQDEAKEVYQGRGEPVSKEQAKKLIDEAERPSPIGGTFDGMPQVHVDLFMEQASAGTVNK
ncbi:oxidoreductase [Erythrobacter sp. HI00D59]|nr:oxidoreductase [Erythrobacter sp. HI00D59]